MAQPVEQFINELRAKVVAPMQQKVLNTPVMKAWGEGALNRKQIIEIVKNFYCLARELDVVYSLWIPTIHDAGIRPLIVEQMLEENEHPKFLLKWADEWGIDRREMEEAEPTPEWGALYYYHAWLVSRHVVEKAAGDNFSSEASVPLYHGAMLEGVKKHYRKFGPTTGLEGFFDIHVEQDPHHVGISDVIFRKYALTDELQRLARNAAIQSMNILLLAFEGFYTRIVLPLKDQ